MVSQRSLENGGTVYPLPCEGCAAFNLAETEAEAAPDRVLEVASWAPAHLSPSSAASTLEGRDDFDTL